MTWISQLDQKTAQDFARFVAKDRPSKGRRVLIVRGRKHLNKEGVVFWHGRDKFASDRYMDGNQLAMRDCMGTFGFRIGVQTDDGEKFFCPAHYATLVHWCARADHAERGYSS